jgi:hypothetical protein
MHEASTRLIVEAITPHSGLSGKDLPGRRRPRVGRFEQGKMKRGWCCR